MGALGTSKAQRLSYRVACRMTTTATSPSCAPSIRAGAVLGNEPDGHVRSSRCATSFAAFGRVGALRSDWNPTPAAARRPTSPYDDLTRAHGPSVFLYGCRAVRPGTPTASEACARPQRRQFSSSSPRPALALSCARSAWGRSLRRRVMRLAAAPEPRDIGLLRIWTLRVRRSREPDHVNTVLRQRVIEQERCAAAVFIGGGEGAAITRYRARAVAAARI